jgi:flagellar hook-associated protein 3 FlgL
MRITNQMVTDANTKYMLESLENINRAQKQVNSQKLFDTPSEDPMAASFSLSLNSTLRTLKTFQGATVSANDWMNASEYAFQQMNDISMKATNLVLSGLNDTIEAADRTTMAAEIDSMLGRAVETANSTHDGQYLFAGFQTNGPDKPFEVIDHTPPPPPPVVPPTFTHPITGFFEVRYNGDDGQMQRTINVGQSVTQNITGRDAFEGFIQRLVQAREALKANDTTMLNDALGGLKTTSASMNALQGASASRWRQVQSTSDFLVQSMQETEGLLSKNEDINLAQGITELRKQESNYQVVMEVASRAISAMTLFDYLR